MDAAASRLLHEARSTCPTIDRLVDVLDESDVIVVLSVTMVSDGLAGDTRFLAATATYRYLHVRIDNQRSRREQLCWLAHELRHATEVAGSPGVQSGADLAVLMRRIGRSRENGRFFETDAAVECGRQAQREVAMKR